MLFKVVSTYETSSGRQRATAMVDSSDQDKARERVEERISTMSRSGVKKFHGHTVHVVPYGVEFIGRMPE